MRSVACHAAAFVLLALLAACRPAPKTVSIGVDNSPPFYIFQPDGTVRGLAVDVLSEAARRSGIRIRWVLTTNLPLDEALASRKAQMWPAVAATPERKAKLYLSDPWIESDYVLVSPRDKPVRNSQDAVGLTVSHARLRFTGIMADRFLAGSKRLVVPDRAGAVREMCRGLASVALIESRMLETLLLNRPAGCGSLSLNISNLPGATTALSIAAVPEMAPLARELRSQISKMVLDGTFETILDVWSPFSAEVARSAGVERAAAVRNSYLTLLAGGLSLCALLLGCAAHRAHRHRNAALAAKEDMRTRATQDSLTGLANRNLFTERLNRSMFSAGPASAGMYGVLFLDLDHFKVINDSLGHAAGDQLLVAVARRLSRTVCLSALAWQETESCTVSRLGGDEFAVLIENMPSAELANRIADQIQQDMSLPFSLEGRSVFTTFSIGVALGNAKYQSAEEILRDADTAMYAAKASGKARFTVFNPSMRARAMARLEIETDLRRALKSRELAIHYQPEVDLATGAIVGFEALLRWHHPKHGLLPPLDFIPLAEETGLITPLGAWVLEEACSQTRRWQTAFPAFSNLRVSVNLSGRQLAGEDLLRDVEKALQRSNLPASCLALEVTETILMEDTEAAIKILLDLKHLGLGLRIDDFGTGYSSLSYLHRLPFDTLKIDRSFVNSMDAQQDGIAIVRTIMALAQSLKLNVVAEGVETLTQAAHLQEMGCGFAQGYYFSKPLAPALAEGLLSISTPCVNDEFPLLVAAGGL
jgi:diguanylate cyclase (GGDEF)-like protein